MKFAFCVLLLVAVSLGLSGCASHGASEPVMASTTSTGCHAECAVCKANADLACLDVTVTDQTPRYEYGGKTYYFCSNSCRDDFARHPEKYASK